MIWRDLPYEDAQGVWGAPAYSQRPGPVPAPLTPYTPPERPQPVSRHASISVPQAETRPLSFAETFDLIERGRLEAVRQRFTPRPAQDGPSDDDISTNRDSGDEHQPPRKGTN